MTEWKNTLSRLVNIPELHGRFLNTLSLLEYIGARKIMKSQHEENITPTVLGHMVEEIRHAQVVKKIAVKVGGAAMKTYREEALLCGAEGRAYIQAIDRAAEEVLGKNSSWANYLLTTLVVEERAQDIYPLYDQLLAPLGLNGPLKAIFREEEEHLSQVTELLKTQGACTEEMIQSVRAVEQKYFHEFFSRIEQEISGYQLQGMLNTNASSPV
jgi:hypothetical protein